MEMQMDVSTDKLMQDLKAVVGDTEDLLKATASQSGEQIARIRARAEESLQTARAVDKQVHDNPWTAIGVAAGLGLVLGIVLGRK
jgi:ElaB/YqjD/DUF883 family membrane-anchored ribosome-binding protein